MHGGLARGYFFHFLFVEFLLMRILFLLVGLKSVDIGIKHMRRESRCQQVAAKRLWWAGKWLLSRGGHK
jgi:hypothetical protein